jgi:hypothetical protein
MSEGLREALEALVQEKLSMIDGRHQVVPTYQLQELLAAHPDRAIEDR